MIFQDCLQWKFGDYPERDPPDPFWSRIWKFFVPKLHKLFEVVYRWMFGSAGYVILNYL